MDEQLPIKPLMPTGRVQRVAPLAGLAARTAGGEILAALRRRTGRDPRDAERHERNAERYVELMGRSRGALMKAGQMLSIVSLDGWVRDDSRSMYQAALGRLRTDAPPMAPELAAAVFEAELGRQPEEVFEAFELEPVAAASIGQVHRAWTTDGRRVAVKIQYPGVEQAIRSDLANNELLATFMSFFGAMVPGLTRYDIRGMAAEVRDRLLEELDYRHEAANQAAFADGFRDHPFIRIPAVVPELSTSRVLVQDLAEGLPWAEAREADQTTLDRWGEMLFRFSVGSMRHLGLFNADPHPGNYLFGEDGTVSFLDFGCVRRFTAVEVDEMSAMVDAMGRHDAQALWDLYVRAGVVDPHGGPTPEELFEWWAEAEQPMVAPQPYTYNPAEMAAGIRREYSPTGPSGSVVRQLDVPASWVFLSRLHTGLGSVLAEMHATGHWRAILREIDYGDPPVTELGELEVAYWRDRQPDGWRARA